MDGMIPSGGGSFLTFDSQKQRGHLWNNSRVLFDSPIICCVSPLLIRIFCKDNLAQNNQPTAADRRSMTSRGLFFCGNSWRTLSGTYINPSFWVQFACRKFGVIVDHL
jgi:hypothetical protein